jgi:hypothetical protein
MNKTSRWNIYWITAAVLAVALFCTVALVVFGITSFFRLSRDSRQLRNSLVEASEAAGVSWSKKAELSFGAFSFGVARATLSLADTRRVPKEARLALQSVSGAEFGIYRRTPRGGGLNAGALLTAADAAMAKRGWERIVGVVHDKQLVAVYIPRMAQLDEQLPACVAVLDREQLVVVAARAHLEPLLELAFERPEFRQRLEEKGWVGASL